MFKRYANYKDLSYDVLSANPDGKSCKDSISVLGFRIRKWPGFVNVLKEKKGAFIETENALF